MSFIFLFISLFSWGASKSRNLYEKTFPRDNTFCAYKNNRIEIQIRSQAKFTEPNDKAYGEYLFFKEGKKIPKLMALNKSGLDSYRLFLGTGPICSKSYGYIIDSETIALLLLKENRPYKDKLVIQFLDAKTMKPKDFIETDYLTNKAQKHASGFSFRTFAEDYKNETGKININNEAFVYHQKSFPIWINYSSKGFEIASDLTFEKSNLMKFFKDKQDFEKLSGWDSKSYQKQIVYIASNHKKKIQCLLFSDKKVLLTGNEDWRCQTI